MRLAIAALLGAVVVGWGMAITVNDSVQGYSPYPARLFLPVVYRPIPTPIETPPPTLTPTPLPTSTPLPTATAYVPSPPTATTSDAWKEPCKAEWRAALDEAWITGYLRRPSCPLPCEFRQEFAALMGYWPSYCWW